MTDKVGSFTSPNYPLQYAQYTYCVWTITVPLDHIVRLTFDQFAIGRANNFDCAGAYVRLYDGASVDSDTVIDTYVCTIFQGGKTTLLVHEIIARSESKRTAFPKRVHPLIGFDWNKL